MEVVWLNQTKRQEFISNLLKVHGEISSKELADKLLVSMMTINRDLKELAAKEDIQLVNGSSMY